MGMFGIGQSVSSLQNGIFGVIGAHYDREFARAQSEADREFQREVFQNQYQWKAADAKKAGLHPLAVIGGGSYSASPASQPSSSSMASVLGKLGEGIGDAATAYMNKDEIAAEKQKADAKFDKEMDLLDAQIGEIRARTSESLNRSLSYSRPMASGREYIAGQTDARSPSVSELSGNPGISILPAEGITGSAFEKPKYDINLSSEAQQVLGDELGQVYNALRKATRENRGYYFDQKTGYSFRFDRRSGFWELISGGGGGI